MIVPPKLKRQEQIILKVTFSFRVYFRLKIALHFVQVKALQKNIFHFEVNKDLLKKVFPRQQRNQVSASIGYSVTRCWSKK